MTLPMSTVIAVGIEGHRGAHAPKIEARFCNKQKGALFTFRKCPFNLKKSAFEVSCPPKITILRLCLLCLKEAPPWPDSSIAPLVCMWIPNVFWLAKSYSNLFSRASCAEFAFVMWLIFGMRYFFPWHLYAVFLYCNWHLFPINRSLQFALVITIEKVSCLALCPFEICCKKVLWRNMVLN